MAETGTSESYYDPASRSTQQKRIVESLDMLCFMVTRGRKIVQRRGRGAARPVPAASLRHFPWKTSAPTIPTCNLLNSPYGIHSTTAAANLTTAPAGGERRAQRLANPFPDGPKPDSRTPALNKSQTFGADRIYGVDFEGWFVYDPCAYASLSSFFAKAQK
ncbi:hypothetical protein B0H14DRAFT_2628440 [Mycena olivaceomarginata]|nr:hypothetical protein B0H14DRAFT_2628440 [Mycena olivaceomarginata]